MRISPKVPGWNLDVNKGPWTAKEDSYSNYTITYQLSFYNHNQFLFYIFEN